MSAGPFGARPLVRSLAIALVLCLAQPALASADGASRAAAADAAVTTPGARLSVADTLRGRSGKLKARFLPYLARLDLPILSSLIGDTVVRTPGVYVLRDSSRSSLFTFITLRPFSDKVKGRVGGYRMGYWPFERRTVRSDAYTGLDGFIEVTPENQDTQVSEHFRLRDFLTKDQRNVWPKYLVLDTKLIDKLELVIDDLVSRGYDVRYLSVMSGFRTPQYNVKGVGRGRADASRHQYGDAADVFVDNDRNGRMAYLDYVGSGAETIAHLRENGRIVVMLCAFQGPPRIVRLYGRGEVLEPQDREFNELRSLFPAEPAGRTIIRIAIERIADSCGFGVPLYSFEGNRSQLPGWASRKGTQGLLEYQEKNNRRSIDGLPALRWPETSMADK